MTPATSSELPYEKALGLAAKMIVLIMRLLTPADIHLALDNRGLREQIIKVWQGKAWTPELMLIRAIYRDVDISLLEAAKLLGDADGLYGLCKGLSSNSMVVLGFRYGLDSTKPEIQSYEWIGRQIKQHPEHVRQLEQTAILSLRSKLDKAGLVPASA